MGDNALAELLAAVGEKPAELQRAIDTTLRPRSASLPDTTVELRSKNAEERRGISFNAAGVLEGSDPVLKTRDHPDYRPL